MKNSFSAKLELTEVDVKKAIVAYVTQNIANPPPLTIEDVKIVIGSRTVGQQMNSYEQTYFEKAVVQVEM